MRKYTLLKTILFASGFTLVSALYAQAPGSSAPKAAAESPDAAFVQQAARGGLAEVALSKLAVDSANSPQVKQFARKMVTDHSENNRQLATIAARENIRLPTEMDSEHMQLRDKLGALHGAAFRPRLCRRDARRSQKDGRSVAVVAGDCQRRGIAHVHQADAARGTGSPAHGE